MPELMSILHLEDSEDDAFLVESSLLEERLPCRITLARSKAAYLDSLKNGPWNLILIDNGFPGFDGEAALAVAREQLPNVPAIILSGAAAPHHVRACLKRGAVDYLLKDQPWLLHDAIRRLQDSAATKVAWERREHHHQAMVRLVAAVQELSLVRTLDQATAVVRHAARELAGADGATFVLREGDKCFYADEEAIAPLWKGQRFPLSACISGWAMLNRQPVIIPDIYQDARIPLDAYRPTFVKSLVMVPIRSTAPIGAIGTYWADHHQASPEEVEVLQSLANTTSVAMENVQVYAELEQRVRERTHELELANRELGTFSYSVSHDLRSPLRGIGGFAELLRKEWQGPLSERAAHFFNRIQSSVRRMSDIIDDLLELARLAQVTPDRVDVNLSRMAGGIIHNFQEAQPHRPSSIVIQPDVLATGDEGLLRIVLENLIGNAWKYSSKKPLANIEFGERKGDDGVRIYFVRDQGAGFDMEHAKSLFAPFTRLHGPDEFPGTGIGLATVQKIIQRHAGRIWAEAEPDRGATFYFTLG